MQIKKVLDVVKTDTYRIRKAEWFFCNAIFGSFTLKQKKKKKDYAEKSQWNSTLSTRIPRLAFALFVIYDAEDCVITKKL